jgi:hypothetical protein
MVNHVIRILIVKDHLHASKKNHHHHQVSADVHYYMILLTINAVSELIYKFYTNDGFILVGDLNALCTKDTNCQRYMLCSGMEDGTRRCQCQTLYNYDTQRKQCRE